MAGDIAEAEARQILALEKFLPDDIEWSSSPENSAMMVFARPLLDESGITIPGLTVQLAYRVPPRADDCKYTFTVFSFRAGGAKRVYQLEVVPESYRSHTDVNGSLYGPHHHIGDKVEEVRIANLGCKNHEAWFRTFLKNANIKFGARYVGPFEGRLFP